MNIEGSKVYDRKIGRKVLRIAFFKPNGTSLKKRGKPAHMVFGQLNKRTSADLLFSIDFSDKISGVSVKDLVSTLKSAVVDFKSEFVGQSVAIALTKHRSIYIDTMLEVYSNYHLTNTGNFKLYTFYDE